ncbi:MAG: two-component system chemotaxis family CheB/CheR fusion [Rhodospirillaceae bacterium]|nr:MAG: two-component system chemotaxis family CheB/CheR fusion [Rhodospirillaceae bacterium]TNC94919.1 MAG: two-component system, chemotaxis family, CheB/CheR fusion protein [Stygiobacter sp.]
MSDRDSPLLTIAIGASAGGLEACRKLLGVLPGGHGMAFILVQHLDPTHDSMMVELLAGHTAMTVLQAVEGMRIEPDHLYLIPPGQSLSAGGGALHLSPPQARHGTRLPFDVLLRSLAQDYGRRAVGIVLSGTGADGSQGVLAIKQKSGLVIAQAPGEAGYADMPRNAIRTGAVDLVLPLADMAAALDQYIKHLEQSPATEATAPPPPVGDRLAEIIDLLRATVHDFTSYKHGTLQRRIERRMALASIEARDMDRYIALLKSGDGDELELLAKDLLINVTGFFRDPKVFDTLARTLIPQLVGAQTPPEALRLWVAGCSTGEEAYSLAMLFCEEISLRQRNVKLKVFASDVDADAIAVAREGLYPDSITAEVSPERLARFFIKEGDGYRVSPELRSMVVFTIQDILSDPPFSRLDLVSCRNLLIYLRPEAQAKAISVFHFALRPGGILVLGCSENVGSADDRFEVVSKPERLYRHIGSRRLGEFGFVVGSADGTRASSSPGAGVMPSRQAGLAELCRRLVMDTYAPAAVLINSGNECLYSLGPVDRYLRVAPGPPSHDVLAMARSDLRVKLYAAIQRAGQDKTRIITAGGRISKDGKPVSFDIHLQPIASDGENLLLVCFVDRSEDEATHVHCGKPAETSHHAPEVAALERELATTRGELEDAIHSLEALSEEQKAVNEEALSVNEEYQSTTEELLTSKEELQSLNEELTALNSQLQETLERQRTTANDLENILRSTDVATLFLDSGLNIRFFTPATAALFRVIPGDIGRPLADLRSLAADAELLDDAQAVLRHPTPIEREIKAENGAWFIRRVLPYQTPDDGVEGVVITFTDTTERRHIADALEAAERKAQAANVAKSRFLAAASHDLRQPLQTLTLLQALLARAVEGEKAHKLVSRLDETLGAMAGMLNTLLDINHIDAGTVCPDVERFPINQVLERLGEEFVYQAQAQNLALRVVPCGLSIDSDPRLLEQMLRNLLSNALKYTRSGTILLGCRRRRGLLRLEVWDTGIGIPAGELEAVFNEYHQLDNSARERSRGLGLGLSIVQRLGALLGHRVEVRSRLGMGSMFAIEIAMPSNTVAAARPIDGGHRPSDGVPRTGLILVVEDDPELRQLLNDVLTEIGHRTVSAADGMAALELLAAEPQSPDLILSDYNLPGGMDGLAFTTQARARLRRPIPALILTGDISTKAARDIALGDCAQLNKPVKIKELRQALDRLLPRAIALVPAGMTAMPAGKPLIHVVDDDRHIREALRAVLEEAGLSVADFASSEDFLAAYRPGGEACLLIDASLPGMSGLELLHRLLECGHTLPSIMITGNGDVPMAVQAMRAGATDFIEKPVGRDELLMSVWRALEQSRDATKALAWHQDAARQVAGLTSRQRQIMDMVLAGHPSKNIAADLGISQRTVENHRAAIMRKTGSKSLPALARLALAAT